jgi:hypothetical protein
MARSGSRHRRRRFGPGVRPSGRTCKHRNQGVGRWFVCMPRYYFDSRDNETFIADEIGVDITSFEEVKTTASTAMADFAGCTARFGRPNVGHRSSR